MIDFPLEKSSNILLNKVATCGGSSITCPPTTSRGDSGTRADLVKVKNRALRSKSVVFGVNVLDMVEEYSKYSKSVNLNLLAFQIRRDSKFPANPGVPPTFRG